MSKFKSRVSCLINYTTNNFEGGITNYPPVVGKSLKVSSLVDYINNDSRDVFNMLDNKNIEILLPTHHIRGFNS